MHTRGITIALETNVTDLADTLLLILFREMSRIQITHL